LDGTEAEPPLEMHQEEPQSGSDSDDNQTGGR